MGLKFVRVIVSVGMCFAVVYWASFISTRRSFRRFVSSAGFPGGYCAAFEVSRPGRGCNRRLALIRGGTQFRVRTSLLDMLVLCSNGAGVAFLMVCIFLRRRTSIDAAVAAIVAYAVYRGVFDPRVIGVANDRVVYAIYGCIVVKPIIFPAAAFVAVTTVTEPVIYAAIISDVRAPITFMEKEHAAAPTPE